MRRTVREVAATSALPQLISSALASAAADAARSRVALSGPGIDGATRLAASPAALWTETLLANRRNVLAALNVFETRLRDFRRAIEAGDRTHLRRLLHAAAASRRRLSSR